MPTTKQEIELYHDDYVESIKRNMAIIGKELKSPIPRRSLLRPEVVEQLAKHGLSVKTIATLLGSHATMISQEPELLAAFEKGRSDIGSRVRAAIIDDALNKDSLTAKLHLDKVFNKDDHVQQVDLNVTQSPLENVSDATLLEIDVEDPSN